MPEEFTVETIWLDLPALAGALSRRLHEAGVPVSVERSAALARALSLVRPVSRRRLYWTARAVLVSEPGQVRAFDTVFAAVFGGRAAPKPDDDSAHTTISEAPEAPTPPGRRTASGELPAAAPPPGDRPGTAPRDTGERDPDHETPVPVLASDEEVLREKHFDALEPGELAELYELMRSLRLATPLRRSRRVRRERRGEHVDVRRTLRTSLRTGGDPMRLAHRRRRALPRRIVLLCDISGSMEPYARAYLQFLTCAAGAGPRAEAFVFATRLTRVTRALASRNPERAIQRAAAAAPDWSSGTRIGSALKAFNDRHGRRGMARGAVVVILSDGWDRGDPALVEREMARLSRLAYRIVWVNPRAAAPGFVPRAGGMAAALPHCDALLSGHSLATLGDVVRAMGATLADDLRPEASWRPPAPVTASDDDEPWGSAEPVPGSSVAMPSGYGPSRGRTTPGW